MRLIRLPTRFPAQHPVRKLVASAVIAVLATAVILALRYTPGINRPIVAADDVMYDSLYRLRTPEDRTSGDVVIVAVDQKALDEMKQGKCDVGDKYTWPWRRDFWAVLIAYLQKHGARAVAFDVIFNDPSVLSDRFDDDKNFAD